MRYLENQQTMSTATAHFAGLPELVDYVAHDAFHARNIDVLDNMRLVSKTFNAAATPYRFSELRIRHTIAKAPLTGKPGLAPFLVHVRHAVFSSFKGLPDEEEPLQRIFAQMPRLESVRYVRITDDTAGMDAKVKIALDTTASR
jgi:hypothetical protein